jgi:hypothetical protein
MANTPRPRTERILFILLRYMGTVCLLALVPVFFPYAWMNAVHERLGMGTLPPQPIVGYLARTASLMYAALGAMMWLCSFDLKRFRPIILFTGIGYVVFGFATLVIDVVEGMLVFWKWAEGPIVIFWGALMTFFATRIKADSPSF